MGDVCAEARVTRSMRHTRHSHACLYDTLTCHSFWLRTFTASTKRHFRFFKVTYYRFTTRFSNSTKAQKKRKVESDIAKVALSSHKSGTFAYVKCHPVALKCHLPAATAQMQISKKPRHVCGGH